MYPDRQTDRQDEQTDSGQKDRQSNIPSVRQTVGQSVSQTGKLYKERQADRLSTDRLIYSLWHKARQTE